MKKSVKYFPLLLAFLLAVTSCEMDKFYPSRGKQTDEETLESVSMSLRSMKSLDNTVRVLLTEGGPSLKESLFATITKPSALEQTVVLGVDPSLVEIYNEENGTSYEAFPASYCSIDNGGILGIAAGEKYSGKLRLTLSSVNEVGNRLPAGHYLLPVVSSASAFEMSSNVVWYDITVRNTYEGDAGLYTGDDLLFVFYVNTSQYDPRLASDYYMTFTKQDWSEFYAAIGNIINLRRTQIGFDSATGRAVFNLGPDMRYILDNYTTYITPLQEEGRKVCISIECANTGLGFCNMTDAQIEDFVTQLKLIFDSYPLDGINLWDRNSGYDKSVENGLPEMNTTSYPRLIVAIREMLGPDRMLTVTDYEEPTEYFWDTEATGGIKVGEYLDYAWSGYCNSEEGIQVIDPWHQGMPGVSTKHLRKPIAGLSPSKYGVMNIPWMVNITTPGGDIDQAWGKGYTDMETWLNSDYQQNEILVFEDIRTNLQDSAETIWDTPLWIIYSFSQNYQILMFDKGRLWTNFDGTYGKWLKDW